MHPIFSTFFFMFFSYSLLFPNTEAGIMELNSRAVTADNTKVATTDGMKDDNIITPRLTRSTISDEKASTVSLNNDDSISGRVIADCPEGKVYDHDVKRCVPQA
ncbi:hypothetical protein LSTR_LSTR006388 [Laodelphax striatellus]|uniref:Chitin-binding type-2 domain-containing protein n=1 Tax=Laodelphax striatellus TaxID=195883 RepID=A0A482WWJ4_LAOST|nr:hypothetical protein LSTR_LSTR006388 [Laodelphax striatellus]